MSFEDDNDFIDDSLDSMDNINECSYCNDTGFIDSDFCTYCNQLENSK